MLPAITIAMNIKNIIAPINSALKGGSLAIATMLGYKYLRDSSQEVTFEESYKDFSSVNEAIDYAKQTAVNDAINQTVTSLQDFANKYVPKEEHIPTTVNYSSNSLVSVLKDNGLVMNKQMELLNKNLIGVNTLLSSMVEATTTLSANLIANSQISTKNLTDINSHLATLSTIPKVLDDLGGVLVSSNVVGSMGLEKAEDIEKAIKEIKINATSNVSMSGIVDAIKEIGVTQNAVNLKMKEKLEQELSKDVQIDGKSINKTELDKLAQIERLKNLKDENNMDLGEMLGLVEDFIDDGFTLDFNPFKFVLDELKKGLVEESEELKVKYNIKGEK